MKNRGREPVGVIKLASVPIVTFCMTGYLNSRVSDKNILYNCSTVKVFQTKNTDAVYKYFLISFDCLAQWDTQWLAC